MLRLEIPEVITNDGLNNLACRLAQTTPSHVSI